MRKVERRAGICLLLAAALFIGMGVFIWRYVSEGETWANFYGNQNLYANGELNRGSVYDRHDTLLLGCSDDGLIYPESSELRKATVHVVGDPKGNIATGAINVWRSKLVGYDLLNGTYDTTKEGQKIQLTIDAEANVAAYEALGDRQGCVGVFNYETGEILCLVNTPSVDPQGSLPDDENASVYFNTFLSGTLTPGSTFKLVTSAAAIDTVSDIDDFSYYCSGSTTVSGSTIRCTEAHGQLDFESALAKSCNGAFGEIAREVGGSAMAEHTEQVGLTESHDINNIETAKGSFDFPTNDDIKLSWAGIGQADDLVNPCAMMVYVGAIANGGEAVQPYLIQSSNIIGKLSGGDSLGEYLDADTASQIKSMMKAAVQTTYGESRFAGLDIYAKSGTAETTGSTPDAWFVGFIDDEDHPYAFVAWVKNGGTGYQVAGPVAYKTLQALVANN